MFIYRLVLRFLALIVRILLVNRIITIGLVAVLLVGFVVIPLLSANPNVGGAAGASATGRTGPSATGNASTPAASEAPDPAVENYVRGMLTFDATMMWNSLHPQFRTRLQSQGVTLEQRRAQMAEMQRAGAGYQKVYYLGGFVGKSGFRYYAYVFTHPSENGQSEGDETAYMFTVAPDGGGIISIE